MIRPSISTDTQAIHDLLLLNFSPSKYEAHLRKLIIAEGDYYEWVHVDDSMVVGHILYSPAMKGGKKIGYHLSPISIHPDYRRQGIASKLMLDTLGSDVITKESVFVLGDPQFYELFGFKPTQSVTCPYDESNQYFRALRWNDAGDTFTIEYPAAFTRASEEPASA